MSNLPVQGEAHYEEGLAVVSLGGELSNDRRDHLQSVLQRVVDGEEQSVLIVDLTQVSYLASFAVAALGYYFKLVSDRGGVLALVLPTDQLRKPFRLAGLSEVIPVFDSVAAARAALQSQGF